ncbi:scavenger receptor cysteine-rich domain-containing protein DMBT1-like [Scyliorhinus torazame]|uniref:scavenger receptor cysteine-rich domain-containing protein DMBT1-like n=1 Tax=Scyliorhinus torazame TaxID=75743 RepID=UPI003B5A074B
MPWTTEAYPLLLEPQLSTTYINDVDGGTEGLDIKFTDGTEIGRTVRCEEDVRRLQRDTERLNAMQLRLTGGTDGCSGRLEVSYNGQWRRFCNPYWLLPHAEVLCRYLDCGFAASTQSNSSYLPWRGLTVMSWGRCIGSEIAPWSCPVPSSRRYQKWCDVYAECSDHPSSPKIDLRRLNGRFVVGETINVPCSTHSYVPNATFYLRKSGALEDVPAVGLPGYQGTATFRLADANRSHEGNYSCMYRVSRGGSTYNSTWSSNVEIFVSDHAAEPQLRVIRDPPRFLPGEWVTVSCSAPANVGWSTFYLAIGQQRLAKFSRLPTATFRVDSLVTPGVYNCSCKYQLEIPGKTLNSTASGKVQITVTDQLQKPSLTRAPGDAGRPIPIRCEAHVGLSHLTFHLSRNSRDQILGPMRAYGRRTYYIFPLPVAASDDDSDYYTCRYSIQSGGRTFTSAESDPLFLVAPEESARGDHLLIATSGQFLSRARLWSLGAPHPDTTRGVNISCTSSGRRPAVCHSWLPIRLAMPPL